MGQVYLYLIVAIITRGKGSTLFEADSVATIVDSIAGKAGTIRRLRFFTQDQGSVEKIESGLETVKSIEPKVESRPKVEFPTDKSKVGHIFRKSSGHTTEDTPKHRELFKSVANDDNSYIGTDEFGKHWSYRMNDDGTQTWTHAYEGKITNAGINGDDFDRSIQDIKQVFKDKKLQYFENFRDIK